MRRCSHRITSATGLLLGDGRKEETIESRLSEERGERGGTQMRERGEKKPGACTQLQQLTRGLVNTAAETTTAERCPLGLYQR